MENRKKLHDYSIIMICFAVLNVFTFVGTIIASLVDGSIGKALDTVEADMVGAVKIGLIIFSVLTALLTFSDAFIGIKGLKVSREPNTDKGYIIAAKIFFVLSVLATISAVAALTDKNTQIIDGILTLANAVIDVFLYALFIKAANAVRKEAMKNA